jgi:hypothetical protein
MIDPERCKKVVNAIRDLSKTEIDELFKLLYKENCEYTQNNNGIFFNLSWVSEETMAKIEQFIEFCNQSNTELVRYETLCDVLNHKLYEVDKKAHVISIKESKEMRDAAALSKASMNKQKQKPPIEGENDEEEEEKKNGNTKVSSSMRFYLLKKRFSKPIVMTTTYENDLMTEEYIL